MCICFNVYTYIITGKVFLSQEKLVNQEKIP